ncbi:hypothetical protein [Nonomuraea sp. NPDC048826]|uniref:hypothetical protein n=1 Tax=Nonomuraea sp. NPDC048826 TaxID=3364347 RepID=UPI003716839E
MGWAALILAIALEVGVVSDAFFMISPFAPVHYSTLADPGPGSRWWRPAWPPWACTGCAAAT